LLLAVLAVGITKIDIVSHALHLPINDAMAQMGINVTILSRLRAIAVIGFILMSRLRDLPVTTLLTKTEPEPQPSHTPVSGSSQRSQIQVAIQTLCSQFSAEEMAQILNGCVAAKKLVLARMAPNGIPGSQQSGVDQQRQNPPSEHGSGLVGASAALGEPEPSAVPLLQSEPEPVSLTEPSSNGPVAREPSAMVESHFWKAPEPSSQVLQVLEPIAGVPLKESAMEQATAREPLGGGVAQPEADGGPALQRLEQAYQSLVAEGKKPSGRALAERAHVHRSTCVEWLRVRQQQAPENEQHHEELEHDGPSMPDASPTVAAMDLSGKAPENEITSVRVELPDTAMMDLLEMEMNPYGVAGDVSPSVFSDSSLPGDTPGV